MGRRIVVLLGHPGIGKGTQAKEIMRRLHIPQISTGDMLRDAIARGTPEGIIAGRQMENGGFAADEIVNGIVQQRILASDCRDGFILDGYPRCVTQAEALERTLLPDDRVTVIELFGEAAKIAPRLVNRLMCQGCGEIYNLLTRTPSDGGVCDRCGQPLARRVDDRGELIEGRFQRYRQETFPLVEHYQKTGRYQRVDGMRPVSEVTAEIMAILEAESVLVLAERRGQRTIA